MAVEIIRADGSADESAFVVIRTLNDQGEVETSEAIKAMKFALHVEAGLALVEVAYTEPET